MSQGNEASEARPSPPYDARDTSEDEHSLYFDLDGADGGILRDSGNDDEDMDYGPGANDDDDDDDIGDEDDDDDDDFEDYENFENDEDHEVDGDDDGHIGALDAEASGDDSGDDDPRIHFRVVLGNGDDQNLAAARLVALLNAGHNSGLLSRNRLLSLLNSSGIGHDASPKDPNRFPKVPSLEGSKLMNSGLFGINNLSPQKKKQVAGLMLDRELGIGNREERTRTNKLLAQSMIPGSKPDQIIHYDCPVYSGQFSDDGNFFFSCSQDFNVRMYDTSNPYQWKHYKTVSYPFGQWTLTDASLSPDNRWLAYTSITSSVSIASTDPLDNGDPYSLELDDGHGAQRQSWWANNGSFGIWSVRFSGDGRELVAGTSAHSIIVFDIESRRVLHNIAGHEDDVNAVCFADKSSPHIVYSGSDDTRLKVWDRRCMGDSRAVGAFVGHIEGLTYIDSKGDGRYILSNGKEQSMKLWDLRMAMSTDRFNEIRTTNSRLGRFDYRSNGYDEDDWYPHPDDNSLVTFRGHKVLRTLIRCHFSPPSSTNSRYVYSGSADGKVYIWNLDATPAGVIDVRKATMGTRSGDRRRRMYHGNVDGWATCVRDASWHPIVPMIVASAWNGRSMARGTCSVHSFHESTGSEADLDMGRSVDSNLRPDPDVLFPSQMTY